MHSPRGFRGFLRNHKIELGLLVTLLGVLGTAGAVWVSAGDGPNASENGSAVEQTTTGDGASVASGGDARVIDVSVKDSENTTNAPVVSWANTHGQAASSREGPALTGNSTLAETIASDNATVTKTNITADGNARVTSGDRTVNAENSTGIFVAGDGNQVVLPPPPPVVPTGSVNLSIADERGLPVDNVNCVVLENGFGAFVKSNSTESNTCQVDGLPIVREGYDVQFWLWVPEVNAAVLCGSAHISVPLPGRDARCNAPYVEAVSAPMRGTDGYRIAFEAKGNTGDQLSVDCIGYANGVRLPSDPVIKSRTSQGTHLECNVPSEAEYVTWFLRTHWGSTVERTDAGRITFP